jgi:hypothetical protein
LYARSTYPRVRQTKKLGKLAGEPLRSPPCIFSRPFPPAASLRIHGLSTSGRGHRWSECVQSVVSCRRCSSPLRLASQALRTDVAGHSFRRPVLWGRPRPAPDASPARPPGRVRSRTFAQGRSGGLTFVHWTKNGSVVSTSPSYTFTMPSANVTLVADFR